MFQYSEERKNSVIKKMLPPEGVPVSERSRLEESPNSPCILGASEPFMEIIRCHRGRPSDKMSAEAKFAIMVETVTLAEEELSQYCRERGLFPEQIKAWKQRPLYPIISAH